MKHFFLIAAALCLSLSVGAQTLHYPHPFQPAQGLVKSHEQPFRSELCLNGAWEFMPLYGATAEDFRRPANFMPEITPLKVPSPWNVNHFTNGEGGDFRTYPSYPEAWKNATIGWMRKRVDVPADFAGQRLSLHFEGILGKAQIWVNGRLAGENFELFLPSEYDVTELIRPGEPNEIVVGVAKASLFDNRTGYGRRTYVGGSMWGIEMAGIWQDVYLVARPELYVQELFVQPDVKNGRLAVQVEVYNATGGRRAVSLSGEVRRWIGHPAGALHTAAVESDRLESASALRLPARRIVLEPGINRLTLETAVQGRLDEWTPESPNLYGLVVSLDEGKKTLDRKYERFGWRQFLIEGDRLTLNGRPIELRGDSWHFTGVPQMTRRYAWAWYDMLKAANANAVRLHAQPFPEFYLDVADEMGICVLDETGIWSSDGGPKVDNETYWESCREHIRRLVRRDKNHASVFGWSVCNETVPVVMHVFKAPEELVQRQLQEINGWVALVRELDPTRPWISGDGETDRSTDLPTLIGHYGDDNALRHWASQGKPWGVGETSMAYYGTPKQTSKINANRSYESMAGRMEAIAQESYDLIVKQRNLKASYASVFNVAWYALQPLPLGMRDESRAPQPGDGVFFPPMEEGRPGMQPERLGPYSTTLNPGYDPELPPYRPWAMFYAVQAANATPVQPYRVVQQPAAPRAALSQQADAVGVFAAAGSELAAGLEKMGLVSSTKALTERSLIVIDGTAPPTTPAQIARLRKAMQAGAKAIVLGVDEQHLDALNKLLPYELKLAERRATSLLKRAETPLLLGLNHADFYFSELLTTRQQVMHYGLTGPMALQSKVLLEACGTDWQRWNYRPETSKTGNVFRSEKEAKNPGAAIIVHAERLYVSSLDFSDMKPEGEMLLRIMLSNLGAQFDLGPDASLGALDEENRLRQALILGAFNNSSLSAEQLLATPFIGDESTLNPQPGGHTGDRIWFFASADSTGRIDIRRSQITGSNENAAVYLSLRLFSPRSLSNLLAEPDMPALDMVLQSADRYCLKINGREFSSGAVNNEGIRIRNLPLEKGWNHLLLKITRGTGNAQWGVSARFESNDAAYLDQLSSAVWRNTLEVTEALK